MQTLQSFKIHLVEEEKSPLTIEKYTRDAAKFITWLGERQISKAEVLTYKAYLREHYATVSVNSMLSAVNSYLSFIGRTDCRVKIIKIQRSAFCAEEKELSKGEFERLLQAAKNDRRLALLMQTICATGIRVSEHRFITVEAVRRRKAEVQCKGKVRTILLPNQLCKALLVYAKQQKIKSGSIFIGKSGNPLGRSRIWAQMKKLCSTAKVTAEKVYPHNLRHLFARTFYSIEKDVVRLADILGHSSINTTRIYTIESGRVHRRQIEKIPLLMLT